MTSRNRSRGMSSVKTSLVSVLFLFNQWFFVYAYQPPPLPFGDINFLVLSDVHSFVGGHPHEPDRNADYGDFYSFYEKLKGYCHDKKQADLWLLNNGNFLHGTGLAMEGNATSLLPIIQSIPWDGFNMGNHEAMYSAVLHDMRETLLPTLNGNYITSNVVWKATQEPFGERYQLLQGEFSTVLLFGFLYHMESSSETILVERIEDMVQQAWFLDALAANDYDAIVVLAHMDHNDPLVNEIHSNIRAHIDAKVPIQFITGHTRKRRYTDQIQKDRFARNIQPGGQFDTVGFVSIPKFSNAQTKGAKEIGQEFGHDFLNTSKTVLHNTLSLRNDEPLLVPRGEEITQMIKETQHTLGLDQEVACPGRDYYRNVSMHHPDSLWRLWREHVAPTQMFQKGEDRLMLVSKESFQYDLRGSGQNDAMTLDDVIAIAPYMEKVIYIGVVPDWMVRRLNQTLNTFSAHAMIPDFVLAGEIETYKTVEEFKLYTHESDVPAIVAKLQKYSYQGFQVTPTGKRSTIYWLDYVMSAFPCDGVKENEYKVIPYFYDPSELEEESSDGHAYSEDEMDEIDQSGDPENQHEEEDESKWTLPPGGYAGYVPGKGDKHKIPSSKYDSDESPAASISASATNNAHHSSVSDKKKRIEERKKRQKAIVKGFALTMATALLLVPVACGVMQLTGRWKDDDDDGIGLYDREEVRSLRRHRRRGGKGAAPPLKDMRPLGEIEIT
ncbi:hypothetical protein IV203_012201 [Nitzschia inconspicua]|uniref:Calcineurin-like phosphoesterase domain-containing protein n=1 Tax=Nitzschia inconspicua TaxID=303405 RepID=A0A9K3PLP8_9STRA|nr:hypothetical protein IV203_012201 [Nitzschia inconspicua]